ncbi:MAG TPA: hypothetical protein VKW09_12700 [bacterium]|nr:hypothetical protein [bacterium]
MAILAGAGAPHVSDELEQAAERLAAPIAKALLGKAAVPDDSPYTTGTIGLLGTRPSQEVLEQCDTLLGPVVIEAIVDPFEPPMPPKITRDQAMTFARALARGEPNRTRIALTAISDKVRELV